MRFRGLKVVSLSNKGLDRFGVVSRPSVSLLSRVVQDGT